GPQLGSCRTSAAGELREVTSCPARARSAGGEGVPHGDELRLRLGQLRGGVGVGDDAAAGEEADTAAVGADLGGAQRDAPLAVAVGVEPPDRSGVAAAVHALDLGDQRLGDGGGGAADGRGGVQGGGELEGADRIGVGDDPGDVAGQVHDVGQVQDERRLGHVHRGAVRRQGGGDGADGVLVLLEVLRRPRQGGGQGEVALVVAGTPDGPGEHAGGDQAALAAHQHLRGGAEHAADVEGPAHRVLLRQPLQRPADVDIGGGGGQQVAGEDDLL